MNSGTYQLGNTKTTIATNSIKFNARISKWPFQNTANSLKLEFESRDTNNNDECNIDTQYDGSTSLQTFSVNYGGYALYQHFYFYLIFILFLLLLTILFYFLFKLKYFSDY